MSPRSTEPSSTPNWTSAPDGSSSGSPPPTTSSSPQGDSACYSLGLYCQDVDALVDRALAAGAHLREAPTTFVSGDRYASLTDPFGVRWTVMTRVEDLSEADSARRVSA